jgi:hypothetical protein
MSGQGGIDTDHHKAVCSGCGLTIWVRKGEPSLCGECKRNETKKLTKQPHTRDDNAN